jgi:hypothetical protein
MGALQLGEIDVENKVGLLQFASGFNLASAHFEEWKRGRPDVGYTRPGGNNSGLPTGSPVGSGSSGGGSPGGLGQDTTLSPGTGFSGARDSFNGESADSPALKPAPKITRKRRSGVSAEDSMAGYGSGGGGSIVKTPKSERATELIVQALKDNIMFSHLPMDVMGEVVAAMEGPEEHAKGACLIEQGGVGDEKAGAATALHMYVVDSGACDVIVDGVKVGKVGAGEVVGELALMYDAPRAATVVARSPLKVWALNRTSFQQLLKHAAGVPQEGEGMRDEEPEAQPKTPALVTSSIERLGKKKSKVKDEFDAKALKRAFKKLDNGVSEKAEADVNEALEAMEAQCNFGVGLEWESVAVELSGNFKKVREALQCENDKALEKSVKSVKKGVKTLIDAASPS